MNQTKSKRRILVLGAGVTGLSSAYHLARFDDCDVTVLEKSGRVGGLATSFTLGPATFDFGPHAFHSQDARLIQASLPLRALALIPSPSPRSMFDVRCSMFPASSPPFPPLPPVKNPGPIPLRLCSFAPLR